MHTQRINSIYPIIKRVLDIIFGIIGCLILIPIATAVKIAYLMHGDNASIFFTHKRIGRYAEKFDMFKFRSMESGAEETLEELLRYEEYREEWDEKQKLEKDPRITAVGAFLRRTSLDEVPQFINVVKGDMSIVGPRPLVEGELEKHNGQPVYYRVRPGITGWWACNGRSKVSYEKRLELEYYYVRNCSLRLDALCILKTISAVISREGAR